ncbi:RagB/SusD family nutrient uptake outer membrane protein [Parasediminibacterium sp. JCM 36343]|uniref:RagB/SusD family nutrient uptake outer membrane protein n=1 Tax=Parasediminibacterium sp. JCM 36343 TaxID=3374279 RepID=UPI003979B394
MKHKLYIITLLIAIAMAGGGCRKFLQTPPGNVASLADVFNNFEGARTAMVGCYDKLKASDYYLRDFYAYPELTGGNIKYAYTKKPVLSNVYNFIGQGGTSDMDGFYSEAYSLIYSTNNALENVQYATDATPAQKNRMLADAYAIRALAYFDLSRVFCQNYAYTPDASHLGLVIKNKNTFGLPPLNDTATVKQVYAQIINDFDSALARYANSTDIYNTGSPRTWMNPDAVNALLARVCLYKGDYAKAYSLSMALINSKKYPLITNSNYNASWSKKNISSESIFELAFGSGTGGSYGDYFNVFAPKSLYLQFAATNDLLSLYDPADVRGHDYLYQDTVFDSKTYSFCKKYYGTFDSSNNIKVIRASELYFIAAEAAVQIDPANGLSTAATLLDVIRKRANPAAPFFTATTKQAMLDEIFTERRRELCYEGHLFFDISRMKRNLVRIDCTSASASFTYPNWRYAYPRVIF